MSLFEEGRVVIGCVYEQDGRYTKHYLKPAPDNIARFICSSDKDKLILNWDDYAVACTMGKFLDSSVKAFTDNVLPFLQARQKNKEQVMFEEIR